MIRRANPRWYRIGAAMVAFLVSLLCARLLTNLVMGLLGLWRLDYPSEKVALALYVAVVVGLAYIPARHTYLATRWKLVEDDEARGGR
jgi:hypothetical protein